MMEQSRNADDVIFLPGKISDIKRICLVDFENTKALMTTRYTLNSFHREPCC